MTNLPIHRFTAVLAAALLGCACVSEARPQISEPPIASPAEASEPIAIRNPYASDTQRIVVYDFEVTVPSPFRVIDERHLELPSSKARIEFSPAKLPARQTLVSLCARTAQRHSAAINLVTGAGDEYCELAWTERSLSYMQRIIVSKHPGSALVVLGTWPAERALGMESDFHNLTAGIQPV